MASRLDAVICELVGYAIERGLIEQEDRAYAQAQLLSAYGESDLSVSEPTEKRELCDILSEACDIAFERGLIESDSVVYRDLFDTKLMGLLMARPSEVNKKFYELHAKEPALATDYFYALSCDSNYIRTDRIKRDLKWKVDSAYGDIDITVNLSKPEKDPKAIAMAKLLPPSGYPKCLLCHENEGYAGNAGKPARQNLRQIPFNMAGTPWYLQYSPYVYYNEHCIALSAEHTPMRIDRTSFEKLLGFVECFPHYFIGSNADLPIVGGSILSHDHMQGGRYTFAMETSPVCLPLCFEGFEDVSAGIVRWPMSVIRISGKDKARLVELADKILVAWRAYTDEESGVYAFCGGEPHNTITPIARRRDGLFELDLVLRNNLTTEEYPLGVFHPHPDCHNIKKENIGLIEVMGLAVLPSRLKEELALMRDAILAGKDFDTVEGIEKHKEWFMRFADKYDFTVDSTEGILRTEVGKTFVKCLEDAGVYKDTAEGRDGFMRFVNSVGGKAL